MQSKWTSDHFPVMQFTDGSPAVGVQAGSSMMAHHLAWIGTVTSLIDVQYTMRRDSTIHRRLMLDNRNGEPFSLHPHGFHVAFADGSLRFLSSDITYATLKSLVGMDDGEVVSLD